MHRIGGESRQRAGVELVRGCPNNPNDLFFEPLYIEDMVLVVAKSHPLATRKRVRLFGIAPAGACSVNEGPGDAADARLPVSIRRRLLSSPK
jgi:DNA-binding transcriptional LysR family regulator